MTDAKGLTVFELFNGVISPVEWRRGGIFISSSMTESTTTESFYFDKKEGAKYLKALNLDNAKRKFKNLLR